MGRASAFGRNSPIVFGLMTSSRAGGSVRSITDEFTRECLVICLALAHASELPWQLIPISKRIGIDLERF